MHISEMKKDQIVCSTDKNGTGYYKILQVNRITVDVQSENGSKFRAHPMIFDRAVNYEVEAFK